MRNSKSKLDTGNIRVLHVDDNSTFTRLTASHLEQENDSLVVETETSASKALERLEKNGSFDCIVSDYEMPGMDGLEFLNKVRDRPECSNLPFILFTGKGNEEIASDAISKGVTDYLQKNEGKDQYKVLANRIVNNVERYRAENELERSEERLRQIIDLMPQSVFVKDKDGKHLLVNESLAEANGTTPEEMEGKYGSDYMDEETAERTRKNGREVIESGEPKHSPEEKITREDGTEIIIDTRLIPFEPAHTEKDAVLGIATDITERKERERELERKNERLEEFASIVSHDLRNPLSVAKGRLDLIEDEEEYESRHLDEMRNAHDRIEELIDDLLTLARQGEAVEEVEEVDLFRITTNCWSNVRTEDAELEIEFDGGSPTEIKADPSRLQQILENLFRNAVEHAGEGTNLEVGMLGERNGFYVEDDGEGIPENEREDVFESGFSTSEQGTGFGLSIVEEISKAHGWDVSLKESDEGGARFEIRGVEFVDQG